MLYDEQARAAAEAELMKVDATLAHVIRTHTIKLDSNRYSNHFYSLSRSIIGQQLSVKAAATIFDRVKSQTNNLALKDVASMSLETARSLGLSKQKYSYLQDLVQHCQQDPKFLETEHLSDEAVIDKITAVKGIGRWTAEMFLIGTLGRMDVFAVDDLGLRRAIEKLYNVSKDSDFEQYTQIAETWRPYRSVASLYLWASLDNSPNA